MEKWNNLHIFQRSGTKKENMPNKTRAQECEVYGLKSHKLAQFKKRQAGRLKNDDMLRTIVRIGADGIKVFDTNAFLVAGDTPAWQTRLYFASAMDGLTNGAGSSGAGTGGENWITVNCLGLATGAGGGTDYFNRSGCKIVMIGAEMIVNVRPSETALKTEALDRSARVMLIYDKGIDIQAVPLMSAFLKNNNFSGATTTTSFKSQSSDNRFLFIRDFFVSTPPYVAQSPWVNPDTVVQPLIWREKINLSGLMTEYRANTKDFASMSSGALYVVCYSGDTLADKKWECCLSFRLYYANLK